MRVYKFYVAIYCTRIYLGKIVQVRVNDWSSYGKPGQHWVPKLVDYRLRSSKYDNIEKYRF